MGYRSDVAFTITVDDYNSASVEARNKFKYVVGMFKLTEFYRVATDDQHKCVDCKELGWSWRDGSITFYVTGWKWYQGFKTVESWGEMWDAMQKIDGISGYFIRSGEDMDDEERDEFGEQPDWDMGYVCKTFNFERTDYLGVTESEEEQDEQGATAARTEAQETNQPEC